MLANDSQGRGERDARNRRGLAGGVTVGGGLNLNGDDSNANFGVRVLTYARSKLQGMTGWRSWSRYSSRVVDVSRTVSDRIQLSREETSGRHCGELVSMTRSFIISDLLLNKGRPIDVS